jgi:hypothetical protein
VTIKLYKYYNIRKPGQSARNYHEIRRSYWYVQKMVDNYNNEKNKNFNGDLKIAKPQMTLEPSKHVASWSSL